MIQSEALSRLRSLLNESTAGFYTDAELYQYLDSGMNIAIQLYLSKMEQARLEDKYKGSIALQPLHTLNATNTTVTTIQEYSLPADFLITDYCEYGVDGTVLTRYPAVLIDYSTFKFLNQNSFQGFSTTNPGYYIRGDKLGFTELITSGSANGFMHYYYKKPTAITSGSASSEIPIKLETHEGIILLAFHLALVKDNKPNEAQAEYAKAMDILNKLY